MTGVINVEEIDWSKAPEGATHYFSAADEWYMVGDMDHAMAWAGRWIVATMYSYRKDRMIPRPTTPSWSGEGLPPVGVACEVCHDGQWYETTIIGIDQDDGSHVFKTHGDYDTPYDGFVSASSFRPIRTPEQIAADEREAAIKEIGDMIASVGPTFRDQAARLYDAGYRKP